MSKLFTLNEEFKRLSMWYEKNKERLHLLEDQNIAFEKENT